MTDWLTTPWSGNTSHHIAAWAIWHARCMVLAWGVLLPLGALLARYFKVLSQQDWPRELDNKMWWHGHRALQVAGVLLMSVGVALAWGQGSGGTPMAMWHAWGGWALVALGWLQIAAGLARGSKGGPTDAQMRGDHYDMTAWRLHFEFLHKALGWLSIAAAVAVIGMGLVMVDAPRWMALALLLWWGALAGAAWRWQQQGRCIDTYQAIWGPDLRHPGNQRPRVGWGARRRLR
jgi:hypothetical protein